MINWLKGWKGIAVGAAFILLSLFYNSSFKEQIADSIFLQIPGYFLIGVGSVLILYSFLATSDTKKTDNTSSDCADAESENVSSEEEN